MRKLLITGFDPFGGAAVNPAWLAVSQLPEQIGDFEVHKMQIPTVFGAAAEMVKKKAAQIQPELILCVGQAGGRAAVTPERIAVNIRDARITDNAGNQPKGAFVVPEGPAAYFSTVPAEKLSQAIQEAGIASIVSNSAGAFVCNDVFYSLLHHFTGTHVKVGFLHVPYLPEQGEPNMPLAAITAALDAAIRACL